MNHQAFHSTLPLRHRLRPLSLAVLATVAGTLPLVQRAQAGAFTAGDLVTYRVGDGTQSLVNTGNSVFLDEYSPTGTLVQSIALPTATGGGSNALIASGTASSEGMLNLSANGQYLALTGYNANLGGTTSLSGTSSATVNRAVDIFDATGAVNSSTLLTDFSTGNNPRSAVASNDGQSFYVGGGAGGVRYATVGSTTSTQLGTTVTNVRDVTIAGGQLYASTGSSTTRVFTVGTGTPTTAGQTEPNLPGIVSGTSGNGASNSPYQFAFADLSSTVAGVDTLYVADDSSTVATGGGISKYSLDNGIWTFKGTILGTLGVRGLTVSVAANGTTVNIYGATGGSTATGGGSLFAYADASGYDSFTSGATASTIATAAANEAFRGIAFVPSAAAVPEPTTVLGGVLLLGAAGWSQRRRLRTLAAA